MMSDDRSFLERMGIAPTKGAGAKPAGAPIRENGLGVPAGFEKLSTERQNTRDSPKPNGLSFGKEEILGTSQAGSGLIEGVDTTVQSLGTGDLADHFLACAKLGRYLTVADNSRFIITDDFKAQPIIPEAYSMAAIFSKDYLVAQSALLPLSISANQMSVSERDKLERLFGLIEEQTLSDQVRESAQTIREQQFRDAEIKALEAELGERMTPARLRYRQFLNVVKQLMDRKITPGSFLDEFRGFTQDVAGRLDFGIYSFCLDRLFGSVRAPTKVKKLLIIELLKSPPLIRRELISNVLVFPGQTRELLAFIRYMVTSELGQNVAIEIELLEAFKQRRLSMMDIQSSLAQSECI